MSIKSICAPPVDSGQDYHIRFEGKGRLSKELCWLFLICPLNSLKSKEEAVALCSPFSEISNRAVLQLLGYKCISALQCSPGSVSGYGIRCMNLLLPSGIESESYLLGLGHKLVFHYFVKCLKYF